MNDDTLDRAAAAALALAAERPWREVALRDIAAKAGVAFADLYALAPSKAAVMGHLARRFDRAALATADGGGEADAHDRLFDAALARLEAMQPHRKALLAVAADENPLEIARRAPATARAILEAAGVDATAPRLAAMGAVWIRLLQVWRTDSDALAKTMAEADKRLKQLRDGLKKIGAGF
ncbi:MAG: putative transcriptional regulator, TetR family [Caulobacter sp.]|nr:putative transcriptional regulator, TetR family [Caulobacter sp.]